MAIVLAFLLASIAWADDDDDEQSPTQIPQNLPRQNPHAFIITPVLFNQLVFGSDGPQAIDRIDIMANQRIDEIDQVCTLSDVQKQKLRLAATGDSKYFRDQFERLKQKLSNTEYNPNDESTFDAFRPLQQRWQAGILGNQSLFQKVLYTTLDKSQLSVFEQKQAEQVKLQYKARITEAVDMLDDQVSLGDAQREELEKLLQATPPPKFFSPYVRFYILSQVAVLPDEKLRLIFDAKQMEILPKLLQRYKELGLKFKQEGFF